MSNKIILKKSSVVSKVPTAQDLEYGEVAINYADGKLYYKDNNNQIQSFVAGPGAGGSYFSTISVAGQNLVVAEVTSDTLTLIAGQGIVLTTDASNDSITISSNVSLQSFNVASRTQEITTTLTPLLQTYIEYDSVTFRNPVAKIAARTGDILVTG
jgi:hypothetical protein